MDIIEHRHPRMFRKRTLSNDNNNINTSIIYFMTILEWDDEVAEHAHVLYGSAVSIYIVSLNVIVSLPVKQLQPVCMHFTFLGSGSQVPFSIHFAICGPLSSSWGSAQLNVTLVPSTAREMKSVFTNDLLASVSKSSGSLHRLITAFGVESNSSVYHGLLWLLTIV